MSLACSEQKNLREPEAKSGRPRHLVVVEDDDAVRRLLRHVFEDEGFLVSEARNGSELLACLRSKDISLITLDLTLRHEDGLALARTIRAEYPIPIVMITAKAGDIDKVVGLELGADDYIAKPFNVREVIARIRAVLRRSSVAQSPELETNRELFTFDGWELDVTERQLRADNGTPVELTAS